MRQTVQFSQSLDTEQLRAKRAMTKDAPDKKDAPKKQESFENYLYGRSLIRDASEKPDWQQTMHGRIATRVLTRGVFGALAFTWAGSYAHRSLKNYHPDSIRDFTEWRRALFNTRATSTEKYVNQPNTMQAIAKAFDVVAGKPIQFAARKLAPEKQQDLWAASVTHFRPRGMYHDPITKIRPDKGWEYRNYGRSLGHEVVAITTDFAAASAADATGRYLVQAIDPNVEKDDEETMRKLHRHADFDWYRGGKFSTGAFAKDTLKKLWTVASFNQGEDWAVAVPYAFFMKWHRNVIDKFSPGFKYASDYGTWNGASDKLRAFINEKDKITKLEKIGDFHLEGAWDLQARFSTYNVLTLMYRDAYKAVGDGIKKWQQGDSWIPHISLSKNPIESTLEAAGNATRYMAKSFIKANIYMQPAVPFFWMWRVPQCKWRGSPIIVNEEMPKNGTSRVPTLRINNPRSVHSDLESHFDNRTLTDEFFRLASEKKIKGQIEQVGYHRNSEDNRLSHFNYPNIGDQVFVGNHPVSDHPYSPSYSAFDRNNAASGFDKIFGIFGKISHNTGEKLYSGIDRVEKAFGKSRTPDQMKTLRTAAHTFADASFSYTPYMIAKQETALRWSNKNMDNAIYRFIDGALSLDYSETKAGLKDIGHVLKSSPDKIDPILASQSQDTSTKPDTKITASTISHNALIHKEHRTLQ